MHLAAAPRKKLTCNSMRSVRPTRLSDALDQFVRKELVTATYSCDDNGNPSQVLDPEQDRVRVSPMSPLFSPLLSPPRCIDAKLGARLSLIRFAAQTYLAIGLRAVLRRFL